MNRTISKLWMVAALLLAACDGKPVLVGYEPPEVVTIDGGVTPSFPTSMGDPFAVDAPITLADNGVSELTSAFDGMMHLVAWTSARGLLAARYDLQGLRLDAAPILLAPPDLLRGGIRATARANGGFDVFWVGPQFFGGSNISSPGYGSLYAVSVDRAGLASLPSSSGGLSDEGSVFDLGLSSDGAQRRLRVASVGPRSVWLRTFGVDGSRYLGDLESFGSIRGVEVPVGPVLGRLAFARLGGRDYLATISGDTSARVLELRALTPRGDLPAVADDPGVVVFSTPITSHPLDLQRRQSIVLEVVGQRVVLLWRDRALQPDGGALQPALFGVSVLPTGGDAFEVSPTVTVAQTDSFGHEDVTATAVGESLLVGVRGIVSRGDDRDSPHALALDPATLLPRSSLSSQPVTAETHLRGCSWDGEACLVLTGVGSLASFVVADRVPLGGALKPLSVNQALPGQWNEQSSPSVACGPTTCLMLWSDAREMAYGDARAIRVDKTTGRPIDADSVSLFANKNEHSIWTKAGVAALGTGFVTAEGRCSEGGPGPNQTMQLVVRTVPEAGELGAVQVIDFPDSPCDAWTQLVVVADSDRALIIGLQRDQQGPTQLYFAQVGSDGLARARGNPFSFERWAYASVDAVIGGDKAFVALNVGQMFTTAVLDLAGEGGDVIGLDQTSPVDRESGPRRLVKLPGSPQVGWLALTRPSYYSTGRSDDWALVWCELGDDARPVGTPRTLVYGRGQAYGLEVAADERGLAVLTAQRTFASEDYALVFRRFDAVPLEQPVDQGRVVARGIHTPGHALASGGDGQWLTAYAESGNTSGGLVTIGGAVSRVIGRFVYEAP